MQIYGSATPTWGISYQVLVPYNYYYKRCKKFVIKSTLEKLHLLVL